MHFFIQNFVEHSGKWNFEDYCDNEGLTFSRESARHVGSYKPGKLRVARHKGRNCLVKSGQLSWAGQYKKFVQYECKCTPVYSDRIIFLSANPSAIK